MAISTVVDTELNTVTTSESRTVSAFINCGFQGPPGKPGRPAESGDTFIQAVASTAVGGHKLVYMQDNGEVAVATCYLPEAAGRVVGMTMHAAEAGAPVDVMQRGVVADDSLSFPVAGDLVLGDGGRAEIAVPSGALFSLPVGFTTGDKSLYISIGRAVFLGD